MREADVRVAIHQHLRRRPGLRDDALIMAEFAAFFGDARVDIVLLDDVLHGFEIKSERDGLGRLIRQVDVYSRCLETVTLVVATRHLVRATALLPPFWGVMAAAMCPDGHIDLHIVREPLRNVALDPVGVARLLWRSEALACLADRGLATGRQGSP